MSRKQDLGQAEANVVDLSHDGRGVAHIDGKAVFIADALPGEQVVFKYLKKSRKFDEGETQEIITRSEARIEPECAHFGVCGGCALQHMAADQQINAKQKILSDNYTRIGKVEPATWVDPITGPAWKYRRRARLSVRYVVGKKRAIVGFRERNGRFVADLKSCPVMIDYGFSFADLSDLISQFDAARRIPQIELSSGDDSRVMVVRQMGSISAADTERLLAFGTQYNIYIYMQPEGLDSIVPLDDRGVILRSRLAEYDVDFQFEPLDFVQVNQYINEKMIAQALNWLELNADDRVLDLFCGLGNFTLPISRFVKEVIGVEGDKTLIARANQNVKRNAIHNARFYEADLRKDQSHTEWAKAGFSKLLLDPPRSGAKEVLPLIASFAPQKIVYVSCHPGSLARDAGLLVEKHGYMLVKSGVMDMFPQTAHVESMALFEKI
ncbi:MAG: 23S rRNA (uracil(1939)-C(5))-methyltransferase RlmD [bacterium]